VAADDDRLALRRVEECGQSLLGIGGGYGAH
jgi:hypothetical protein